MTKKPRSPAAKRARSRQTDGDPRPYMVILREEQVREAKETGTVRGKPTRIVTRALDRAADNDDRPMFLEPQFEENE